MNTYANFYYDPARQGYDTTQWRTLFGDPNIQGNNLVLQNSAIIHYADLLRGQFSFNLNIPSAPTAGQARSWGLRQINKGSYIYFQISDTNFTANTANGYGNTTSVAILGGWSSAWTSANTEFRIKWEGGTAKFYINQVQVAVITDNTITGESLSLYASNGGSDNFAIVDISCVGIQGFWWNTPSPGAEVQFSIYSADAVGITENRTQDASLAAISKNEAVTIADVNTVGNPA